MPVNIFCSYARKDIAFLNKLKQHLTSLQREGLVSTLWYDHEISAGTEWEKEIDAHLNSAQIILLLVSPDFIASEYCYSKEVQQAMERHEKGEATVIPIILRPVSWQGTPFSKLHALPKDARPITDTRWNTQDFGYYSITEGIRKAIHELTSQHPVTEPVQSENTQKSEILEAEKPLPQMEQPDRPISVEISSHQLSQSINTPISSSNHTSQSSDTAQQSLSSEKAVDVSERLKIYRSRLAHMEVTLDLGRVSEFTDDFAKELDHLLREIVSTMRTMPPNTTQCFKSESDVLENLRQARIQVIMALESIPYLLYITIMNRTKPEAFYQALSTCREYLEIALNNW